MRHVPARWPVWLPAVAASLVGTTGNAQPRATPDTVAIARYVEAYRDRTGLPGAAIAITHGGDVVYVAGFGHGSDGAVITAQTRLPVGSLSKSVTALAVMQLVEAGRVRLDEPVQRYLPEFAMADPRASRITVRQLLDHHSGMSDARFREKSVPVPASLAAGVAMLHDVTLATDPGAAFHYHNPNYWVAARLVEVVGGEPFATYLRRHVLEPAGMLATTTVASLREAPDVARGHSRIYGVSVARTEPSWYLDGSSGIVTTAGDLARWLIVQNTGGRAVDGTALVTPASVTAMHDQHLGWKAGVVPGEVSHNGWLFTYTAQQLLVPASGYGIAVVANRGLNAGPDDAAELTRGIVTIVGGGTAEPGAPVGLIVDVVMVLLTLGTAALGVRSLRRRPATATRRALGIAGWLISIAAFAGLRRIAVFIFAGRDANWTQLLYVAPSLAGWLAVSAAFGVVVIARRLRAT